MPRSNEDFQLYRDRFIIHLTERAIVAKLLLVVVAFYFTFAVTNWSGRDAVFFGVYWLNANYAFLAGGLSIWAFLISRDSFPVLIAMVTLVGLACMGRTFSVWFSEVYDGDERMRALGWVIPWLGVIVSCVQILAANAIRKGRALWTG